MLYIISEHVFGDNEYLFCEIFKFGESKKAFMNFVKSVVAYIFAVFKYFAEQIIYSDSPEHALQNDIEHVPNLTISRRSLMKSRNQTVDI